MSSELAQRFDENRTHLRAVAYRMLGSLSEADDAIQEAWLRLSRSDASAIHDLRGWLTTVVARVSLDMLRARRNRPEEAVGVRLPEPLVSDDHEHDAMMAESVSLALLVVLETLTPAERLTFVLHDMFDIPFEDIAALVGKTPAAARQLASRARRRVQGAATSADADVGAQREVVMAFLAAARAGDFDALVRVLDPEIVVRRDLVTGREEVRDVAALARSAMAHARGTGTVRHVTINGTPGIVSFDDGGELRSVLAFTIRAGKIVEIYGFANPDHLRHLDLASLATSARS